MDQLLFYLSNQFEALQVQTQILAQHGQQWIIAVLSQVEQFIKGVYTGQNVEYIRDAVDRLLLLIQKGWEQVVHRFYSMHFNASGIYSQVLFACSGEVSRREAVFCVGGLTVGVLCGYYIGINWRPHIQHLHRIKAVICHQYIGPEGVALAYDVEMPSIRNSNELLIEVKAACVNVIDNKISYGYSKMYRRLLNSGKHKELPVILGRECAGVVIGIGHSVMNFDIGDKVFLAVPSWCSGTMAQYIVVPESQVVKRPKNLSFEAAASVPYNGCLAWDALVNDTTIEEGNARGKRVLIYGGVTPVGCILTQLVKLWGGYVLTICTPQAVSVTKALGADDAISLGSSDIEKELQLHDKFDAIFYTGGPPIDERILHKHLTRYGSYVSTVPEKLTSDSLGTIGTIMFTCCVKIRLLLQYIFGFNSYQWKDGSKITDTYLQALCDLADIDQLQTVVDRVYMPHSIEQALEHVLDQNAIGSTVITFQ